jgi:hypothetical protein
MVRLLKLGIYDAAYLDEFYRQRRGLPDAGYAEQHAALIGDRAASSDFWTAALRRIGYETADIVANAAPLQRRWATENGRADLKGAELFATAAAQIKAFAPDILLVADYANFSPSFLRTLRADCPSIRRIVGWCGAPFGEMAVMREWDVALSCVPEIVSRFRDGGLDAHHVDHGFDPRILDHLAPSSGTAAFTFIGSIVKRPDFHHAREQLLVSLLQKTPLEIRSRAARRSGLKGLKDRARRAAGRILAPHRPPPLHPLLVERAKPPLYGLAMFQALRDSAVTLNTHIDISVNSASNMRLFEATGVGTCLLTDHKDNLATLFEPDREVVTYRGPEDAVEKYRYLASRPAERAAIAAAGQKRALRDHNFDKRAARLDRIFRASLASS